MRWLLLLIAAVGALFVVLVDTGVLSPFLAPVHTVPHGDKLLHVSIAGVLALVTSSALAARSADPWRAMFNGALLVAALLTVEEATNVFTPFRACTLGDLVANYLGVALVGLGPLALVYSLRPIGRLASAPEVVSAGGGDRAGR